MVMIQANAADQELLVYLPDHRAGAAGLTLRHSDGHSKTGTRGPLSLRTQGGRKRRKVKKALRKHSNRARRVYSLTLSMSTRKK